MKKFLNLVCLILVTCFLINCQSNKPVGVQNAGNNSKNEINPTQISLTESPVISPTEAIKKMQVEDGFEVKLVASEPLIHTPVAMVFDEKNRIYVVEMEGYMPDTVGTGEDIPSGKIVVLEDKNKDGVMDERKIFLDGLVLPRAICLVENGILVAEPTNLWFYEINGDKAGKKTLVDPAYTEGGNVEHQPNGLLRNLDNWIYNAKSSKRYRKMGDKWLIERTHFRGQWGISQDNHGRLYYNTNSENLLTDYFLPGFGAANKNQRGVAGFNEKGVADNKVFPLRPTPGVNRGYMKGVLDTTLRLVNFTAACSPLVYRGDLFSPEYVGNVFVAEPSANLIKRNIIDENGYVLKGRQAYKGREFLASVDERFRPVSLYNGPDGAMYIVDMYRGIIQHKTYLTTYLKNEIGKRKLTQPLASGRIYKVVPKNKNSKMTEVAGNPEQLIKFLGHSNGWVRDKAQQLLIDGKFMQMVPALEAAMKSNNNNLMASHALWTLEGLGALKPTEVIGQLKQTTWPLRMQALGVVPSVLNKNTYSQFKPVLEQMLVSNDSLAAPYVAFLASNVAAFDKSAAAGLVQKVAAKYSNNRYVADAAISSLENQEEAFLKQFASTNGNPDLALSKQLQRVISGASSARGNRDPRALIREFPKGAAMFNSTCQTCHGADGNGVKSLAPPLNQSEWVTGNKDKLISIVLFGLTGPVKVNNHVYKAPEINGDMPGIGYSDEMKNEDIAQLVSFIRKSWRNDAEKISTEEVAKVRTKLKGRQKAFTVAELDKM